MPYSQRSAPKGGFLKAIGKVAGAVGGFLTGGPAGAVAGHSAGGRIAGGIEKVISPSPTVPTKQQLIPGVIGRTVPGQIINTVAGWAGYGPGGGAGSVPMVNGQCPVGYHPNKQASAKGPARSYCVRNRSMNPANGRAIGRAATRIKKGAAQYSKVLRILGKKTGKMVPRARKRR